MSNASETAKKIRQPDPFYIFRKTKNGLFVDACNHYFYLKKVRIRKGKFVHATNKTALFFENEFVSFCIPSGSHVVFDGNALVGCSATNITIKSPDTPIYKINSPLFEIRLGRNGMIQMISNHEISYRYYQKDGKNIFKRANVHRTFSRSQKQLVMA